MALPDGPRTLPSIQLMQAIVRPLEALDASFRQYGDIYTSQISTFGKLVVVSNPKALEEIMTAPPELFDSGRGNRILEPYLGQTSLILQDGKDHQRQRKLLIPPFHGERLKAYGSEIEEIARQVSDRWQPGRVFSAREVTQEISLRVIMRTVFGVHEGEKSERIIYHFDRLLALFNQPLNASFAFLPALQKDLGAWSPWGNVVRQRAEIDKILYSEIRERRANPALLGEDILSLMLAARDEEGKPMTELELRDEMMTLLFAGHETTATAMAWALYWMHHLPEVGEKVLKELAELGEDFDPVTVSKLPYLSAVCQETLRIYPIALFAFSRILKAPWKLLGYELDTGTQLSPCIYLLHHRPDLYPEPKLFRPERFLERSFSPYEYLPFGGGNRRCIGMTFALFEMKLALATIMSRWQLKLASDRPVKAVRRGITLAPNKGVMMQVVKRR